MFETKSYMPDVKIETNLRTLNPKTHNKREMHIAFFMQGYTDHDCNYFCRVPCIDAPPIQLLATILPNMCTIT
jgi:hypothetical protein